MKYTLTRERLVDISRRNAEGETLAAIAKEFGVSRVAVANALHRHGLPVRPRAVRGAEHGSAKFSDEQVQTIFLMREQGAMLKEIAATVGCSKSYACTVLKGRARATHTAPQS